MMVWPGTIARAPSTRDDRSSNARNDGSKRWFDSHLWFETLASLGAFEAKLLSAEARRDCELEARADKARALGTAKVHAAAEELKAAGDAKRADADFVAHQEKLAAARKAELLAKKVEAAKAASGKVDAAAERRAAKAAAAKEAMDAKQLAAADRRAAGAAYEAPKPKAKKAPPATPPPAAEAAPASPAPDVAYRGDEAAKAFPAAPAAAAVAVALLAAWFLR